MKLGLLYSLALAGITLAVALLFDAEPPNPVPVCDIHGCRMEQGWKHVIRAHFRDDLRYRVLRQARMYYHNQNWFDFGEIDKYHDLGRREWLLQWDGGYDGPDSVRTLYCPACRAGLDSVALDPYWRPWLDLESFGPDGNPISKPSKLTQKFINMEIDEQQRRSRELREWLDTLGVSGKY